MTKRDFELIARVLRDTKRDCDNGERSIAGIRSDTVLMIAERMALELRQTNPAFNHARFMRAAVGV